MKVAVMELRLYAPWVHSLKEKRMVVKSLLGKIRSRYAVSAAETAEQDIHQTIVIGVAAIVAHAAQADSMMDDILAFVENSTEAEIVSVERDMERAGMVRGRFLWIKELVLVHEYIQEMFASISNRIFRKPLLSHRMSVKISRDSSCKGTRDGINRRNIGID